MISNETRTCTCPGDSVTFTCTTIGGEATLWSGSVFPNNCDITLNHSRFSNTGGVSGFCSDQGIVGLSVKGINNHSTSQLTVPVNSDSINRTVKCTVIYNSTATSLIGTEVIATTGKCRSIFTCIYQRDIVMQWGLISQFGPIFGALQNIFYNRLWHTAT